MMHSLRIHALLAQRLWHDDKRAEEIEAEKPSNVSTEFDRTGSPETAHVSKGARGLSASPTLDHADRIS